MSKQRVIVLAVTVQGLSKRVLTDNGSCYHSYAFKDALGPEIKHKRTRPYRPQTNGKVERYNRTMLDEWAYAKPYASESDDVPVPVLQKTLELISSHTVKMLPTTTRPKVSKPRNSRMAQPRQASPWSTSPKPSPRARTPLDG